jgi:hypothetical protein
MGNTLLQRMAEEPCESFTGPRFGGAGTCMSEGSGRTPDAPYLADRYCPSCRLRAALAEEQAHRHSIYAEGYADGYTRGQQGEPPYVEPSAPEDIGELEYGVVGPTGKIVNNGDYRVLQTHARRKAGPWLEIPQAEIVQVTHA